MAPPAREVSVQRVVYAEDGEILYEDRWDSSYLAEKRIVRVGTGQPPEDTEPTGDVEPVIPVPA